VDPEPLEIGGQTYYQWQVPNAYEAGWHSNSARLGEVGNTVLNGHHNIHGEIFRHLVELKEGDKIILYDADNSFVYLVTETEIMEEQGQPLSVRVKNAQWIEPTEDERITIVTCWPYTDNTHRLVVVARPATETDS
jgi:sortase A